MPTKRKPKYETQHDGERVRVYVTRSECEVIFGEGDIDDLAEDVYCYPKSLGAAGSATQAILEHRSSK